MLHIVSLLLAAAAIVAGEPARIPDIIEHERAGLSPVWVSAETAVDKSGDLRSDVIASHRVNEFRKRLEKAAVTPGTRIGSEAADGCDTTTSYLSPLYLPTGSPDDLVKNSRYILSGSVTALREGFYFGSPGTLLAIRPTQWLKHETEAVVERSVYVFFSRAKIKTSQGTICSTPVPTVPMPTIGDDILIFAYYPPAGRDAAVFELRPDKQMYFHGPAGAYVPNGLRPMPSSDLATIVQSIRVHPQIGHL